jgi:hypothetical protein
MHDLTLSASAYAEREEHLAGKQEKKFGGRKIPFRSAQR